MSALVIAIAIVIAITLLLCVYTAMNKDSSVAEGFRGRGRGRWHGGGGRRGGYWGGPAIIPVGTHTHPVFVSDVPVIGETCILREDLNDPYGRRGVYKYYCS